MNERPSKKSFIGRESREDKRNNSSVFPVLRRKMPLCQIKKYLKFQVVIQIKKIRKEHENIDSNIIDEYNIADVNVYLDHPR